MESYHYVFCKVYILLMDNNKYTVDEIAKKCNLSNKNAIILTLYNLLEESEIEYSLDINKYCISTNKKRE